MAIAALPEPQRRTKAILERAGEDLGMGTEAGSANVQMREDMFQVTAKDRQMHVLPHPLVGTHPCGSALTIEELV